MKKGILFGLIGGVVVLALISRKQKKSFPAFEIVDRDAQWHKGNFKFAGQSYMYSPAVPVTITDKDGWALETKTNPDNTISFYLLKDGKILKNLGRA